jgi:hypothetical protein
LVQTIVLSFLYTWLHLGTRGSLFIASLFHAFGNIAGAAIPYWTTTEGRWVSFSLLFLFVVLVVVFSPQFRSNWERETG